MIDAETMLDRIAAAESLGDLEALRVAALGKSGSVTALLKSLGSMDPAARATEAPKVHALREAVSDAIASRKDALETAELERKLDPRQFCRIHRSTLVNLAYAKEVDAWFGGRVLVRLKDTKGTELQVAKERAAELKKRLGI